MLKHLTIKNYALIRHLEMQPSGSLNVITGETGAGKSIMLGALGMLMGNRADTKVLWDENEKCVVEAAYDIRSYKMKTLFKSLDLDYDDTTLIRREISANGKSRAFINDTPVNLDVLKKIGSLLMDIHSQHETLELGEQDYQLHVLDTYADNDKLLNRYHDNWQSYQNAKHAFQKLQKEAATLREEADYIRFQFDELSKADLSEDEQEKLESELKVMEHAEEIKSRFNAALDILAHADFNVQNALNSVKAELSHISSYSNNYETLFQRLDSVRIEIEDISDEIEKEESKIEFDPERTEFVKERLSNIYRLQKKHRVNTIKDLLTIHTALEEKNNLTSNLDGALTKAESAFKDAERNLLSSASDLTDSRKKKVNSLSKEIVSLLKELGIPDAEIQIALQKTEPGPSGTDKIDIQFSANKGVSPRSLVQVASGGEFSRLMFAIKYILASKTAMPTLVLDEIDNGISGQIAIKLGSLMQTMSKKHQLITISHLPQIAAKGDRHYFVYKDNSQQKTVSNIRLLSEEERVEEIAKMIGGEKPTKTALENAQELLSK